MEYFESTEVKSALQRFVKNTKDEETEDKTIQELKLKCEYIASAMLANGSIWDAYCPFNISHIGDSFLRSLERYNHSPDTEKLKSLFVDMFRFMNELNLGVAKGFGSDFERVLDFGHQILSDLPQHEREQLLYAMQQMPINILKSTLYSEEIKNLIELKDFAKTMEKRQEEWERKLNEREKRTTTLKDTLEKYEHAFNFVGLYQGFANLRTIKLAQKSFSFKALIALGIFLPIPVISNAIYLTLSAPGDGGGHAKQLFISVAAISTLALLLYFFRIVLQNFRSLQSQILQLDLRMSLCQFIQEYASYAKEVKTKDSDLLLRFEAVIFSNIMPDSSQIPAIYDGVDELAKLIKAVKTK